MKKRSFVLIGLLVLFAIYYAVSPYIAVHSIRKSIKENDPDTLLDYVDFEQLRQNFKDQINLQIVKSVGENHNENPFNAVGTALATKVTEGFVDSRITPYGVLHILQGNPNLSSIASDDLQEDKEKKLKEFFSKASYKYSGLNNFTVLIPFDGSKNGKNLSFHLKRYGLKWKLTNINFPFVELLVNQKTKSPNSLGNQKILTSDINSRFLQSKTSGLMFVITGRVKNRYSEPRKSIQVASDMYTKDKKRADTATSYCGNMLNDLELTQMNPMEIRTRLGNISGDNNCNIKVNPNEELPFMIVFFDLPENLDEFTVAVIGSSSCEK